MILQCFSSQVFVALQLFVMQSTLSAFVVGGGAKRRAELVEETSLEWRRAQTARLLLPWPRVRSRRVGRPSRRAEWRLGLGLLIDAMDRGVEALGPEPPAWWQPGQPMQLTMATVAEHVVVQEDIVMAAVAEPAGDEPAVAGDGAGADEPAEPCTKRRKTHVPSEVKEWFCSLARVMPDWTMTQCFRFAKRALPSFFEHMHIDTPRKWFSHKTPGTALGRPRSLEPAVVLALADIVSRVCSKVCCGAGVLAVLMNAHLETLGVAYRFSDRSSRRFMRSLGYSFKKPKGELGKEWPEATTRTLRELCQQKIEWTLNDAGITDRSRIINIDETCCKMLPLLERGWTSRGVPSQDRHRSKVCAYRR